MANASRALHAERAEAWARYGGTRREAHPRTGVVTLLSGQRAFNRLANKLLQIDTQTALPAERALLRRRRAGLGRGNPPLGQGQRQR